MKKRRSDFKAGYGRDLPPSMEHVRIYFSQKGLDYKQADFFYQLNQDCNWTDHKGQPVKNWKTLACDWIWEFTMAQKKNHSVFSQGAGKR
jgi:hypothetical protein